MIKFYNSINTRRMIQGETKTEAQYRAIYLDSSSSLKDFSMDRKKYHKKYILNQVVEDEESKAATTGRLVETLLMEPHLFDEKFHISTCMSTPTAMMLDFVEALYKYTVEATTEDGMVTRSFEDMCKDAYADAGFKITLDAVLKKFIGSEAEIYYKEIREVRSKKLTVVTTKEIENAEKVVLELRTNSVTAEIVNLVNDTQYSVFNQLQVEGYDVLEHKFKSMMDKVIVDHKAKTVQVYDLKCTWSVENFYSEYYLYRRAYIQGYLYHQAAQFWASECGYGDYTILYPKFIVCDSTNYMNPLVYAMTMKSWRDAVNGFEYKGREYPGVKQLIEDLKWTLENDVWNISRENHINNGIVNLD
jgi:hypothetical protein